MRIFFADFRLARIARCKTEAKKHKKTSIFMHSTTKDTREAKRDYIVHYTTVTACVADKTLKKKMKRSKKPKAVSKKQKKSKTEDTNRK